MSRTHKDMPELVKVMHGHGSLGKFPANGHGHVTGSEAKHVAEELFKGDKGMVESGYYYHMNGAKNSPCPGCPYCTESEKYNTHINHGDLRTLVQYANGSGYDDELWNQ